MAPNRSSDHHESELQQSGDTNNDGSRPIFSLTMDPNALEQEIDQAAQALHSTVNSLLNTMQSSVFGGLETLSREMSAFEKNSKEYFEQHPLQGYHQHFSQFPWSFRTDGPKKRYRITIEELPPLEDESSSKIFSKSSDSASSSTTTTTIVKGKDDGDDFTISQGKAGTPDEGKTVITASVAPGLLDWLLFTTHDDSFFKRLGNSKTETDAKATEGELDIVGGTKIRELTEAEQAREGEQEAARRKIVPALVEKITNITSFRALAKMSKTKRRSGTRDDGPVAAAGDAQRQSFSQTTVTRPDGTVEHHSVSNVNGEVETVIKIHHPDGSIEETVTRENHGDGGRGWGRRLQHETNEDRNRDSVVAVVSEAMAAERDAAVRNNGQQQQHPEGSEKSKSWPPKTWIRRQDRNDE
ncbi:hypothetical protein BC939DRAFT_505745 [Gamsiella multidivaricata]|uniref:uncharacterized protein n=1 Tax=Gamsiella multidivaricata TaxID=101098 RepID=UPI00222031CC|nr:uncharacterized protein BC939DRAFT_505745 [Gamsiella multidivaricata]KAI7819398.1 hypothetical protein BC939DRAFT_505745 [Gamsiella multidivaricata]